jgi:hypothetical protein
VAIAAAAALGPVGASSAQTAMPQTFEMVCSNQGARAQVGIALRFHQHSNGRSGPVLSAGGTMTVITVYRDLVRAPANGKTPPGPGPCAFWDRPVSANEPATLAFEQA